MSVIINFFSDLRSSWYCFQSNPLLRGIAYFCDFCLPFTLGLAAFVIVEFYSRVTTAYKSIHKSAHYKYNWFSVSIIVIPIILNFYYYTKFNETKYNCLFSFTFISSLLSLGIPIIVQRKNDFDGSFFQITITMGALYYCNYKYIYYFWLSIPIAFMIFKNENAGVDRFRKRYMAPYLLFSFLGIFISYYILVHKPQIYSSICIIVGSFFALILSH